MNKESKSKKNKRILNHQIKTLHQLFLRDLLIVIVVNS